VGKDSRDIIRERLADGWRAAGTTTATTTSSIR
jgi:hypothetical protein